MKPEHDPQDVKRILDTIREEVRKKRIRQKEKLLRDIESGLINGKIFNSGAFVVYGPKGIQNWHDTRTLIRLVTREIEIKGYCPINIKHCLQVRGKHLRRLLKKMPYLEQRGNILVDTRTESV
jgi:hypothetical protein